MGDVIPIEKAKPGYITMQGQSGNCYIVSIQTLHELVCGDLKPEDVECWEDIWPTIVIEWVHYIQVHD